MPDPGAETQYLHFKADEHRLRYATDIHKEELLDHDGDVAVSIALSQYRTGAGEISAHPSQLRVDTTQIYPYMNIIAPLAWTAIASLVPDKAGKVSLDQLGFRTPQAKQGTSKILLTQGTGKLAVNISKAPTTSIFVKALHVMIAGAKIAAPLVALPAISVPALSSFTEALSYWEDRTKFLMAGNLTSAVATQHALADAERESRYIGLVSGDYLMLPMKHTDELAKELPNLELVQGYLVRKDADPNLPIEKRAQAAVPGSLMPPCGSVCRSWMPRLATSQPPVKATRILQRPRASPTRRKRKRRSRWRGCLYELPKEVIGCRISVRGFTPGCSSCLCAERDSARADCAARAEACGGSR